MSSAATRPPGRSGPGGRGTSALDAHRGTFAAHGFVLDTPVIGGAEAADRVLALWQDGAALYRLPYGGWLLTLAEPVEVRADRAPGVPLVELAGALVAVGAAEARDAAASVAGTAGTAGGAEAVGESAGAGEAVLLRGGEVERHTLGALPVIDPSTWLDLSGLTIHQIGPSEREPDPLQHAVPLPPAPDLRVVAGVGARSERAARLLQGGGRGGGRLPDPSVVGRLAIGVLRLVLSVLGFVVVVAGLVVLTTRVVPASHTPLVVGALIGAAVGLRKATESAHARRADGGRPGLFVRMLTWQGALHAGGTTERAPATGTAGGAGAARRGRRGGLLGRLRRRTAEGGGSGAAAGATPRTPLMRRLGGALSRLALGTPAAAVVRGRHARYLRELEEAFAQRRWEDALRDAIAVAGGSDRPGWLSLALPRRRTGALRPTARESAGGGGVPYDVGATEHLTDLYRRAAGQLEREGRVVEAAFVLADLLARPIEAVGLLERHKLFREAAELSEGRGMAAELAVRLWWRAGERERALGLARRRGAFAAAVQRLGESDRAAALELRAAWVESCRESGDRLGAIDAAWPEESLRPGVVGDLQAAVALGGRPQARALARLLALGAGEATRGLAVALLTDDDPQNHLRRIELVRGLVTHRAADQAVDREVATAAVRALVRAPAPGAEADAVVERRVFGALIRRADPLVAADLRLPSGRTAAPATGPVVVTADDRPGGLPVRDAAVLHSGAVLAACGQAGVLLLSPDGRVRARWDTPADRIVLADHGGTALLAARYGGTWEVARLDLATRAVRRWATVRARDLARSFDGRTLITLDPGGLTVLDTLAAKPTVVWHELDDEPRKLGHFARTPGSCSVVVGAGPRLERWRWDLPGWELRSRLPLDPFENVPAGVLGTGRLIDILPEPLTGGSRLRLYGEGADRDGRAYPEAPGLAVLTDGDECGVVLPAGDGAVRFELGADGEPRLSVLLPGADLRTVGLRAHADTVTVWDGAGRIVAAGLADGAVRVLANVRTPH